MNNPLSPELQAEVNRWLPKLLPIGSVPDIRQAAYGIRYNNKVDFVRLVDGVWVVYRLHVRNEVDRTKLQDLAFRVTPRLKEMSLA